MGVNFPQAKYSGTRQDDSPPVPDGGKPQPILRTEDNFGRPNVHWGPQPTGNRQGSQELDVPTGAVPHNLANKDGTMDYLDSTDIRDPNAVSNQTLTSTNPDIFKGSDSDGGNVNG